MCSDKQLAANRRNAQHSTGPRTPEGKARSSHNALTHGLTAATSALLPTESEASYLLFCDELRADLRPRTALERTLADRLIQLAWRLRRLPAAETEFFHQHNQKRQDQADREHRSDLSYYESRTRKYRQANPPPPAPAPLDPLTGSQILAHHFAKDDDPANPFARLHRYEASLERQFHRLLTQYKALQKDRAKNPPTYEEEELQNEPIPLRAEDQRLTTEDSAANCQRQQNEPIDESTESPSPADPLQPNSESVQICAPSVATNQVHSPVANPQNEPISQSASSAKSADHIEPATPSVSPVYSVPNEPIPLMTEDWRLMTEDSSVSLRGSKLPPQRPPTPSST